MPTWVGGALAKVTLFAVGSLCYALLGIFSQLSKAPDGSYAFSMPSVICVAEAWKLCISLVLLSAESGSLLCAGRIVVSGPLLYWIAWVFPSALYSVNNNLDMLNNLHMDPATEQVLVQGKILTTGIVWWLVFKVPLGFRQWLAIILLFFGAALAAWPSSPSVNDHKTMYIDNIGVLLVSTYIWVSACAGVYNEWLYKCIGKAESIHASNVRLYFIGVLFNLSGYFVNAPPGQGLRGLLDGFNRYTWCLVATYALMGLLLAQVMKFFDNIVKLFISGSSMYISAVLSWSLFGYTPTPTFLPAIAVVTAAMLLYNADKIFKTHHA